MREIVYKDEALLNEMLGEWIDDSENKMIEIKTRLLDQNWNGLFNKIHELKTNFSMIHCYTGIQCCELLIEQMENINKSSEIELDELNLIVFSVNRQLKNIIG